jgi:hypothetical protein
VDLWNVTLSLGAVLRHERVQSAALAPVVAEVRAAVQQAAVVNVDETGWRQEQRRAWLWTAVTPSLTAFLIDRSRGGTALEAFAGGAVRGPGGVGPLVGIRPVPGGAAGAVLRAPEAGLSSVGGPRW